MLAIIALTAGIICTSSGSGILICEPATAGDVAATRAAMQVGTYQSICVNSVSVLQRDSYPGGFKALLDECGQRAIGVANRMIELRQANLPELETAEVFRSLRITTHR